MLWVMCMRPGAAAPRWPLAAPCACPPARTFTRGRGRARPTPHFPPPPDALTSMLHAAAAARPAPTAPAPQVWRPAAVGHLRRDLPRRLPLLALHLRLPVLQRQPRPPAPHVQLPAGRVRARLRPAERVHELGGLGVPLPGAGAQPDGPAARGHVHGEHDRGQRDHAGGAGAWEGGCDGVGVESRGGGHMRRRCRRSGRACA